MEKLDSILTNVGDLGYKRRLKEIIKYLDVKPGQRILDCGCGEGFYTMVLTELYDCEVYAADHNPELLRRAENFIKKKDKVKFINDNFEDGMPFEDNFFDAVIFTEVLEHLDNEEVALKEIKRVLKTGGKLALTVPSGNYPFFWDPLNWIREAIGLGHFDPKFNLLGGVWSYDHKRLYEPDQLKEVVEISGLKINTMLGLSHYCIPFNLMILYVGKQLYTRLPVPKTIKNNMEKFDWKETEKKKSSLIEIPFKIFKDVDSANDGRDFIKEGKSFITLLCGAEK